MKRETNAKGKDGKGQNAGSIFNASGGTGATGSAGATGSSGGAGGAGATGGATPTIGSMLGGANGVFMDNFTPSGVVNNATGANEAPQMQTQTNPIQASQPKEEAWYGGEESKRGQVRAQETAEAQETTETTENKD